MNSLKLGGPHAEFKVFKVWPRHSGRGWNPELLETGGTPRRVQSVQSAAPAQWPERNFENFETGGGPHAEFKVFKV